MQSKTEWNLTLVILKEFDYSRVYMHAVTENDRCMYLAILLL
jgi:hypothetical protein